MLAAASSSSSSSLAVWWGEEEPTHFPAGLQPSPWLQALLYPSPGLLQHAKGTQSPPESCFPGDCLSHSLGCPRSGTWPGAGPMAPRAPVWPRLLMRLLGAGVVVSHPMHLQVPLGTSHLFWSNGASFLH